MMFMPKNVKAGFATNGLFPFNPDRILRYMPKPPADPNDLTISRAEETNIGSCPQDEISQTSVTPISVDSFISLQNLIIKEIAHVLNDTCKQKLERHILKFTKTGQQGFVREAQGLVREALKDNRIELLDIINNEAKVRCSTKLLVLGKAKIMNYEDLEEAQAKRAEKEAAKKAKGNSKRGRKRKRATPVADVSEAETDASEPEPDRPEPEPDEPEPSAKIMRMSKAPSRASVVQMSKVSARTSVVQMSGAPAGEAEMVPHLWKAPVARMW